MIRNEQLHSQKILVFWAPLAATWLMMAFEGPFLAAIIARLAEAKYNLAAYGVAFSFAVIIEAPVIMMMSASTALVDTAHNFRKLRTFTYALNGGVTLFMLVILFTPLYRPLMEGLIGLPAEVASLTHQALVILLPWPGAIGYRRFYQGILIRQNLTRRVAYGTVVRLLSMAGTGLALYLFSELPGASVGATALTVGVCAEAVASRLMAWGSVRRLVHDEPAGDASGPLDYRTIIHFYYPLALTSTIGLAVHPMVTFFMGHARFPLESLAVLPVVNSLVFIFRSLGLSYQEAVIALEGTRQQNRNALIRFGVGLSLVTSALLGVVAFTPLADLWFRVVSGLTAELSAFALLPTRILVLIPGLAVLLSLQRGLLVNARKTGAITWATIVEVGGIATVLLVATGPLQIVGATAAAISFVLGRIGGNLFLIPPCLHGQFLNHRAVAVPRLKVHTAVNACRIGAQSMLHSADTLKERPPILCS